MSPTYSVCRTHGYLAGEVYKCPECGQATEVYSRITGYYRPVQNWNDGKAQEFKDRKVYDMHAARISKRHSLHPAAAAEQMKAPAAAEPVKMAEEPAVKEAVPVVNLMGAEKASAAAATAVETRTADGILLFATTTCPNCKIVAAQMDRIGVPYEKIYANEQPDMARKYGIRQAPTLVVQEGEEIKKFTGVSEVKKYLASL